MYGGTITDNTAVNGGGGVYLNGDVTVSGEINITGNYTGALSDGSISKDTVNML